MFGRGHAQRAQSPLREQRVLSDVVSLRRRSRPSPTPAPERAVLALPARVRMEDLGLDRVQDLGHQPEEPEIRGPISLRPVSAELRMLRLGEDVKA
jgi:hypothetical protein